MKVRGGMWCECCAGPVAGQKATHQARNTALTVLALPTYGASLLGARVEGFDCPHCGGPAGDATSADHRAVAFAEAGEERAALEAKPDRRPRVRKNWTPVARRTGAADPTGDGWDAGQTVRRIPRAPREERPLR